ncbi:MAG: DNA polymerase III subunit gamma/tau, partial [Xanthomonadales bacterium]|nr:DNA polymerase III subunit gamma/tau [Xanthomonadales bacterium]
MSYQVLARKWRPKTFAELVGQEHVSQALINGLDQDRLHHAFLFTGTRGVGKTTIARILAKCLNCETGVSSKPCGECGSCVDLDEGRFVDMIEIDAASRTGVDDMRELLDAVQYTPSRGRYKVYIIDEVHMLSTSSFNALLKTLEEPPPHVKFVLATTDPQKIPVTILSRCLQFNLRRLLPDQVAAYLKKLVATEGIEAEPETLTVLARAADGSMRDGLSLLDQAIAFGGGKLVMSDLEKMLGLVDHRHVTSMVRALADGDAENLLAIAGELVAQSRDLGTA